MILLQKLQAHSQVYVDEKLLNFEKSPARQVVSVLFSRKKKAENEMKWHELKPKSYQACTNIHANVSTVSIGPSHMESFTGMFTSSPKQRFPTFYYRTSSFCCALIFSPLEPSKDKQDSNRFWKTSSYVTFLLQSLFLPCR